MADRRAPRYAHRSSQSGCGTLDLPDGNLARRVRRRPVKRVGCHCAGGREDHQLGFGARDAARLMARGVESTTARHVVTATARAGDSSQQHDYEQHDFEQHDARRTVSSRTATRRACTGGRSSASIRAQRAELVRSGVHRPSIWNGREEEDCDTTGTSTDGGYTEAQYNFNVATFLKADLRAEGAKVVMTRTNNERGRSVRHHPRRRSSTAPMPNVAVDIHADGGRRRARLRDPRARRRRATTG